VAAILSIVAIGICTAAHGAVSKGRNKPEGKAYKHYVTIIHQIYKREDTGVVRRR
jgi:hypothetical protein